MIIINSIIYFDTNIKLQLVYILIGNKYIHHSHHPQNNNSSLFSFQGECGPAREWVGRGLLGALLAGPGQTYSRGYDGGRNGPRWHCPYEGRREESCGEGQEEEDCGEKVHQG